jgi:hypothetical protein
VGIKLNFNTLNVNDTVALLLHKTIARTVLCVWLSRDLLSIY